MSNSIATRTLQQDNMRKKPVMYSLELHQKLKCLSVVIILMAITSPVSPSV